jgi:hypothetical protein
VLGCASPFGFSLPFSIWLPSRTVFQSSDSFLPAAGVPTLVSVHRPFGLLAFFSCRQVFTPIFVSRRGSTSGFGRSRSVCVPGPSHIRPRPLFLCACALVLAQSACRSRVSRLFSSPVKLIGARAVPDLSPNHSGFQGPVLVQRLRSSPSWIRA